MNAEKIRARFAQIVEANPNAFAMSQKQVGVLVGILNKAAKGDPNRKLILKYLCGETSTKKMTNAQLFAMKKMTEIAPQELERVCGVILAESVRQDGQAEMAL